MEGNAGNFDHIHSKSFDEFQHRRSAFEHNDDDYDSSIRGSKISGAIFLFFERFEV